MTGYYAIAAIALLAAISPGPDFVIIVKQALAHDRRSAVMASIGIGVGIVIHAIYCVLGLAIVISQSLLLFSLIKYLGAAYLIYLGGKSLFSKHHALSITVKKEKSPSLFRAFCSGLLTNVLNPKCTLFMLSVFTLVVKPHTSVSVQAIYGLEISLITAGWFVFLSYGFTITAIKRRIERVQHWVDRSIGVVLIALGAIVVFETRG